MKSTWIPSLILIAVVAIILGGLYYAARDTTITNVSDTPNDAVMIDAPGNDRIVNAERITFDRKGDFILEAEQALADLKQELLKLQTSDSKQAESHITQAQESIQVLEDNIAAARKSSEMQWEAAKQDVSAAYAAAKKSLVHKETNKGG